MVVGEDGELMLINEANCFILLPTTNHHSLATLMNPIVYLLTTVISIYSWCVIISVVLSLLISFRVVNRSHPVVYQVELFLNRLVEPALKPIRKYLPDMGGIDISPIILLIALNFLSYAIVYYSFRI